MDRIGRPTLARVVLAALAALLLVIVVGGVTEELLGNGIAQGVRKTILIGSILVVTAWVMGSWAASRSSPP